METLLVVAIIAYFANFFYGRSKNAQLADIWFKTHKSLLEDNFSLVGQYTCILKIIEWKLVLLFQNLGDDGKIEIESSGLIKETESTYALWCSGRTCCEGMLVELKFIKVRKNL